MQNQFLQKVCQRFVHYLLDAQHTTHYTHERRGEERGERGASCVDCGVRVVPVLRIPKLLGIIVTDKDGISLAQCNVVTSCHVTSCHVTSRHVMSRHVMSCHVTSRDVMSRHVMSRHVTSCHVTSCHVMSRPLRFVRSALQLAASVSESVWLTANACGVCQIWILLAVH